MNDRMTNESFFKMVHQIERAQTKHCAPLRLFANDLGIFMISLGVQCYLGARPTNGNAFLLGIKIEKINTPHNKCPMIGYGTGGRITFVSISKEFAQ